MEPFLTKGLPAYLPNKPLVESIAEIKWGQEGQPDPAYPIIVGRLFERLKTEYPSIEDLPITMVPAEMTVHQVRHRFRKTRDGWPLVQIGPGVLTVNDTDAYHWEDFSRQVKDVLPHLYAVHPSAETLSITSLLLRYINAVVFDYSSNNVLQFLAEKLRVSVSFAGPLLNETGVRHHPQSAALQVVFPVPTPAGALVLLVGTGKHKGQNAIVWEIHFRSLGAEIPKLPDAFPAWLEGAHAIIEKWFLEMVKGEL